jgi:hypothetical protein
MLDNLLDISQDVLSTIFDNCVQICHFSDPFHLVKRDRYRKISQLPYIVDPFDKFAACSRNDLEMLGIPSYLLSGEQARKMEDNLPLLLFTKETLIEILKMGHLRLFFAMLPSTLLLESIHSEFLNRQQRIDLLMIGASVILLYEFYKKVLRDNNYHFAEHTYNKIASTADCFKSDWSYEYISVTLSTAMLLCREEMLDLGACGTHILEHYLGAMRRHSTGDDTYERFIRSMQKVLLEHQLLDKLGIQQQRSSRRSDSGVCERGGKVPDEIPLIHYLSIARGLLGTFMNIPEGTIPYDFANPGPIGTLHEFVSRYMQFPDRTRRFSSTKKTGKVAAGGIGNQKRFIAARQITGVSHGHVQDD